MHPGPVSLLGNDFADNLLREMAPQLDKARLPAGATVAHLAFYLAEHLGCDPIIFVGQDLGFSDGLSYVPGTGHDDAARPEYGRFYTPEMRQWETIVRDRRILREVPDYQGRPTYTEERLFAYLQQFERDFLKSKSRVIDATEGGAAKRGATPMPLAEAIRQYCATPLDLPRRERPPLQWEKVEQALACLGRRADEAERVEQIAGETLPLLRGVRDHLDDQRRVNQLIAQIDVLRARMNEFGPAYDLIMQLTQSTELRRFQADLRISAAKLTGVAKQRKQVERDIDNVEAVRAAAAEFRQMIATIADELKARHETSATSPVVGVAA
jgi:hypothetical protein